MSVISGFRIRSGLTVAFAAVLVSCTSSVAQPSPTAPSPTAPSSAIAVPTPSAPPTPTTTATAAPTVTASPIATTPNPATPTATALPPSPSPSNAGPGWKRVADQPTLRGAQLDHVIWADARFIATGVNADSSPLLVASPDGVTWTALPPLGTDLSVGGIATSTTGTVIVGASGSAAMSWFSSDGAAWTAAPDATSLHPTPHDSVQMRSVTATDSGWLAVGEENGDCQIDCDSAVLRAVVWTSLDGLTWTREPDALSLARAAMTGVVRGGPGFVAVGRAPDDPTASGGSAVHAVVWTSPDGQAWTRLADAPVFHAPTGTDQTIGASMHGVTVESGTLVAVGTVGSQDDVGSALAWWSSDGIAWSAGTGDDFHYGQMFAVAAVPEGFIGTGPSGPDSCLGGVWSSPDGHAWTCIASDPAFDGFVAYDAAASPDKEVVVGFGDSGDGTLPGVWVRALP